MKRQFLILIVFIGAFSLSSCSKAEKEEDFDITTKSEFSYGKYGRVANALDQVIINGSCILNLDQQGFHEDRASLYIAIANFNGVGTYDLADGNITIYGYENKEEMYWSSLQYHREPGRPAFGEGKIEVKRCDERFVAVGDCILLHREGEVITTTNLSFKTDQRIIRPD